MIPDFQIIQAPEDVHFAFHFRCFTQRCRQQESSAQHLEVCSIGAQERPNSPQPYPLCHYVPLRATIVTVLFALSRRKCMASRDFCGEVSRFRGQLVGTTTGGVSWEGIVEGLMSDSRSQLYRMPLIS